MRFLLALWTFHYRQINPVVKHDRFVVDHDKATLAGHADRIRGRNGDGLLSGRTRGPGESGCVARATPRVCLRRQPSGLPDISDGRCHCDWAPVVPTPANSTTVSTTTNVDNVDLHFMLFLLDSFIGF